MPNIADSIEPIYREPLSRLGDICQQHGGKAYMVGGSTRSALLGEPVVDFDIEVFGIPADLLEKQLAAISPVSKVGKSFGIFKLHGLPIDVGLPRSERKAGTGHRGFEINIDPYMSLEEASRRRDFTVNAIYFDITSGELHDPQSGIEDLRKGVLRHCSERFAEDPLRVMRAMQFAARIPARVADETILICKALSPENLSPERYYAEWEKLILQGKLPSNGLKFLEQCEWLKFFPQLQDMKGCMQDPRWHPEGDVWTHTMHCMDAFALNRTGDKEDDLVVGLAVLCHDMGKPMTTEIINDTICSRGHETAGLKPARAFMEQIKVGRKVQEQVLPLIKCHMRPATLFGDKSSPSAIRRLSRDCGRLDLLLRVFSADAGGRPPMPDNSGIAVKWILDMADKLNVKKSGPIPLLRGHDLLDNGWSSGPELGSFLKQAYEAQLEGEFETREQAILWLNNQLADKPSNVIHSDDSTS